MVDIEEEEDFDHGEITDDKNLKEIQKISHQLESDEKVLLVARQSRIKPGGAKILTPHIVFATNKRIIIRNPNFLGARETVEDYRYESITSVKLEKGIFSSAVNFVIPGMTEASKSSRRFVMWGRKDEGVIDAIPKFKAEKLVEIVKEGMEMAKKNKNVVNINAPASEDPMKVLKVRFAKGEISKEEFEEMKKALE